MKKLAIFVEGETELIFIEKLILEIGESKDIIINKRKLTGGNRCPVIETVVGETKIYNGEKYQILIYCSCNDEKVLSDINEQYSSLIQKGYTRIIGVRDLYPKQYDDKNIIEQQIKNYLERQGMHNVKIILAIMEIETWFIAEHTHYSRLHPQLTLEYISRNVQPNLNNISNFEQEIQEPATMLHEIYSLVGYAYKKRENQVLRTVNNLSYEELYINTRLKVPSLNELISELDSFFT